MLCFQALCQIICLCISIISRSPEILFSGTVPDYLFMYFYYFQKSRNVMFSGTESDYLFIYVFLFPEMLSSVKCGGEHVFPFIMHVIADIS